LDNLLETVRAVLSTTPLRWQQLVSTLPVDLLTRPPVTGEWSALDCLGHLLDTERQIFHIRIQAFLAGQDLVDFFPDEQRVSNEVETAEQLAAAFAQCRQESLTLLKQVRDQDVVRRAQHSELGSVTLGEQLSEWVAHDLMHTVQAERALMQPFILGCPPWRHYFRDHDVAQIGPGSGHK
jgi:uncharacterized damage-inducible protein DinB